MRFLADEAAITPAQFDHIVNHESGLLGLSETSGDIRDLLASEADDPRAAEAIALFCYQAKKTIGAYAAALGGLDTLVFAGGIGENAPVIRDRICDGLDFLGITIDPMQNAAGAALISRQSARVTIRVIATDEEQMIATLVSRRTAPRPIRWHRCVTDAMCCQLSVRAHRAERPIAPIVGSLA